MATPITGVYMILNRLNDKVYIGSSIDVRKRWNSHKSTLRNNTHRNRHLQHAWNLYGPEAFEFILMFELPDATEDELRAAEEYWLVVSKALDEGYNICREYGTPRGVKRSDEFKAKLSQARKKMVANGYVNPFKGKTHTIEVRKAQSERMKGNILSEETKKKISDSLKHRYEEGFTNPMAGRTFTDEHRKKIGDAHRGKTLTEEHKRRISEQKKIEASRPGWFCPTHNVGHTAEAKTKMSQSRRGKGNKVQAEDVPVIRSLASEGMTLRELSDRYGVGWTTIHAIVTRKSWKHIP